MVSKMCRLLLVTLVVIAFVGSGSTCSPARKHWNEIEKADEWYCPPGKVMFMISKAYRCFDISPDCPNGAHYKGECHCFPGIHRDRNGVCGKICSGCDNGWCSSPFKCECNEGFSMSYGRCIPSWEQPFSSHRSPPQVQFPLPPPWHHHHEYSRHNHFHQPPPMNFNFPPGFLPQPPIQLYPQLPPQSFPEAHPQQEPGIHPQSPPEFPSQSVPQFSQTVPPPMFPTNRPEVKPFNPNTQSPFGYRPKPSAGFQPESSAEFHTEFPPLHRGPDPLPGRPYPFDANEAPHQPSSLGKSEDQRCSSEYNWDPKSRTCIWSKAKRDPQIDLRIN